jgi:predicted DNA-binding transcriptional regulator YafY
VTSLVNLIRFFEAGGAVSTGALAEQYRVSQRTALRWLVDLERWVPLVCEGGYWRRMQ